MFSIKDLEYFTGIKAHTIRIWEKRHELLDPIRTDTNIRVYSNDDLRKVLNIAILNNNGFKISKIAHLTNDILGNKADELFQQSFNFENFINRLILQTITFDEVEFRKTIYSMFNQMGIEHGTIDYIFPFMKKMGILWQNKFLSVAHENFICGIIRNIIIEQTEKIMVNEDQKQNSRFLLYLPEKQHQELTLLFIHYMLKRRNFNSIYLGSNLPSTELVKILNSNSFDNIIVSISKPQNERMQKKTFSPLQEYAKPSTKIFVHGEFPSELWNDDNFSRIINLNNFKEMLLRKKV